MQWSPTKFGSNWTSGFREEDLNWTSGFREEDLNVKLHWRWPQTQNDDNSSPFAL
jgi:hypothetical protein